MKWNRSRPQLFRMILIMIKAIILFVSRLFKLKKRFRDVFGTFIILLPRLNSAVIVLGKQQSEN